MKLNTKLLLTLIRIQSRMRGLIMRKKVKSVFIDPNNKNFNFKGKFTFTNNNKIVYLYFSIFLLFLNSIILFVKKNFSLKQI